MNIISKKGYALPIAIMFTIIIITTSIGLYASIRYYAIETRIKEIEYIRGYYAAIAGLRYAAILLQDPEGNCGFDSAPDEDEYEVTFEELIPRGAGNFFDETGIDSQKLTITIIESTTQELYNVSATYSY